MCFLYAFHIFYQRFGHALHVCPASIDTMSRKRTAISLLLGLLIAGILIYLKYLQGGSPAPLASPAPSPRGAARRDARSDQDVVGRFRALQARERELDRTIWADEILAQEHEQVFIDIWDAMRRSANQLSVLSNVPFEALLIGTPERPVGHEHGIEITQFAGSGRWLSSQEWKESIAQLERAGLRVEQSEWRMTRFDKEGREGATSTIAMTIHATNSRENSRYSVQGDLEVSWRKRAGAASPPRIESIDARRLTLKKRVGDPFYSKAFGHAISSTRQPDPLEPVVILYDLDRDGLSEIIVATKNILLRNLGDMSFEAVPLVEEGFQLVVTGLIADFTGDGNADFLGADTEGLLLWPGDEVNRFRGRPDRAWMTEGEPLFNVYGMSAGDIDADGDLDVWFGQYKMPYVAGQMPTPYYDANDGFPAFLLENDGKGRFSDVTEGSGIAAKRFRRTYSGSLADLDDDADLDLITLNDFAGVDIFRNDGEGHFTDVTEQLLDQRHLFGMSHSFGDFNLDGILDIFALGMTSNFADRLDQMDLGRPEFSDYQRMRSAMRHGNRLYFGSEGRFVQLPMSGGVRDAGWAWGATSFDFDNDADQDLYAVNGHITRSTARDYDSEFWIHDIYVANSELDPAIMLLFRAKARQRHNAGMSHGGNHYNRLFINERGQSFLEAAFLMDVAVLRDCRNVLSEDLDGDGRLDLIVTIFEKWPRDRQEVLVYRNSGASDGNWIGFRFDETQPAASPVGAKIEVVTPAGRQFRQIVSGESYRVQDSLNVHFGLGTADAVTSVRIRWPSKRVTSMDAPRINAWNRVSP